jgi:hypothetical protein
MLIYPRGRYPTMGVSLIDKPGDSVEQTNKNAEKVK